MYDEGMFDDSEDVNIDPELVCSLLASIKSQESSGLSCPMKKARKRGAHRKPYVRKSTKTENKTKKERKTRVPKPGGKKQGAAGSLYWFVQQGAIKPAPKYEPNALDPSGYHHLKDLDLSNSPYTILVGRYKTDERFFVVGRESSDHFVLVYLPDIEIFSSPTSAPSYFIKEYQEADPEGVKNEARMSGFEYLRFLNFKMGWMHECEEYITLKQARRKIEAEMQPSQQAIRNSEDLNQNQYPEDLENLDPNHWKMVETLPIKPEYPYDSYPSSELVSQCSSYVEFPSYLRDQINYIAESKQILIKEEDIKGGNVQMPELEQIIQELELTDEQMNALMEHTMNIEIESF